MDKSIDIVLNLVHPSPSTRDHTIQYFEGSYNEFFHQFLVPNQPCIIRNVTQNWGSKRLWVTDYGKPNIDYLKLRYGNAKVTVANCDEKYYNAQLKTSLRFSEFAEYWRKLIQEDHPLSEPCLYLKVFHSGLDWHFSKDFPEENVYTVPPEFSNDWLNEYYTSSVNENDDYRFVYMGPKGSWTPFHADVFLSYSWSVNICGVKKWVLLPPGEEEKLKDKFGNLPYDISFLEESNDSSKSTVRYLCIIQKAGDAIFVPSGWHHQVWNLVDTISINHNWINACNVDNMWSSMLKNLEDVKKEINEFKYTMEDWENHCQILLKTCFGMDFRGFYDFLCFILERRQHCINTKKNLEVFGKWVIGERYLEYDLKKVKEILHVFLNHPDTKICLEKNNNV